MLQGLFLDACIFLSLVIFAYCKWKHIVTFHWSSCRMIDENKCTTFWPETIFVLVWIPLKSWVSLLVLTCVFGRRLIVCFCIFCVWLTGSDLRLIDSVMEGLYCMHFFSKKIKILKKKKTRKKLLDLHIDILTKVQPILHIIISLSHPPSPLTIPPCPHPLHTHNATPTIYTLEGLNFSFRYVYKAMWFRYS